MDSPTGFVTAFVVGLAVGSPLIGLLRSVGARQTVSEDAPARHAEKQGTPTMGGLLILIGLGVPAVYEGISNPQHQSIWMLFGLTLSFGLIGLLDDFLIAGRGKNLGLKAREKLVLQFALAAAFVLWLRATAIPLRTTEVRFWADVDLGDWYYVLGVLLIVGMSNAINFLDGLDGLAAGVCALIALALAATVNAHHSYGWLAMFCASIAGACAGFLWFNSHPARVFMGDTGSLALGASLSGAAMLGKVEVPVQFYSIIPWATLFSVMIQVGVFKFRKRRRGREYAEANRVFRRTPLHHHFEELGWQETLIVGRFWLVTALAIGVTLAVR